MSVEPKKRSLDRWQSVSILTSESPLLWPAPKKSSIPKLNVVLMVTLQVLAFAREKGKKVKVIGNGHSPSDIACTTDYMISLCRYNKVLSVSRISLTESWCYASYGNCYTPWLDGETEGMEGGRSSCSYLTVLICCIAGVYFTFCCNFRLKPARAKAR